jgi:hypothetical protein
VIEGDMRCSFEIVIPGTSEQLRQSSGDLLIDSRKKGGQLDTPLRHHGKSE